MPSKAESDVALTCLIKYNICLRYKFYIFERLMFELRPTPHRLPIPLQANLGFKLIAIFLFNSKVAIVSANK